MVVSDGIYLYSGLPVAWIDEEHLWSYSAVGLAGFKTVLSTIVVGTSPSLPKARRVARQTSEASSTSYICTTSSSGTIRQRIQASPARTILVLVSSLGGETLSSITCLH